MYYDDLVSVDPHVEKGRGIYPELLPCASPSLDLDLAHDEASTSARYDEFNNVGHL
jgi:hypothetical protein